MRSTAVLLAGRDPELFAELWRACAGLLVEVPQRDERVFYFLQGHLEQLQEPTDPALLADQIKMFQVPYKIICKVVNVELKAETLKILVVWCLIRTCRCRLRLKSSSVKIFMDLSEDLSTSIEANLVATF